MTLTKTGNIQCDSCGAFLGFMELQNCTASHTLSTPDAEGTTEEYESECSKCMVKRLGISPEVIE